jgi:hypothetical protein
VLNTGGGDRNLGEMGHRGASFMGSPLWVGVPRMVASEAEGSSAGVVEADSVRVACEVGMLGRPGRDGDGLASAWLFLRDRLGSAPVEADLG